MSVLALYGGSKAINRTFSRYNSIGKDEVEAAKRVVETGVLSQYLAKWSPEFYGGQMVQSFERAWEAYFKVRHAVTVNSCTSGLMAAVGAVGVEPGDEVIVSPWTMSASATAILVWNAVPVFADIERETFNLDPASIEKNISPYTKAIVVPDIFGHAAALDEIMAIARKHGLKVIEDAAQAPGAFYKDRFVGTVADIGVFSLNYHKHIHTGEGGVCVTDDEHLAERMRLIRNHAEAVVEDKGESDLVNMIGFNFRMNEVEAAIGMEQLKKLNILLRNRIVAAERLTQGLESLPGLRVPMIKPRCTHVYYGYHLLVDSDELGIHRDKLVDALRAEGVPASGGYSNLHLLPIYQKKIAYGKKGFPWSPEIYKGSVSYEKGICPVAEDLRDRSSMAVGVSTYSYTDEDIDSIIAAFRKVWENLSDLRDSSC